MTNLRNLKTFIFLVLVTLTIASCSKNDDPKPAPAAINTLVTGVYPLTYYKYDTSGVTVDDYQIPYIVNGVTLISGTFTVTAVANSTTAVTLKLNLVVQGSEDSDGAEQFDLVKDGATYNLMQNGAKYGTIDGKNLNYDASDTDPVTKKVSRLIISARKYD